MPKSVPLTSIVEMSKSCRPYTFIVKNTEKAKIGWFKYSSSRLERNEMTSDDGEVHSSNFFQFSVEVLLN